MMQLPVEMEKPGVVPHPEGLQTRMGEIDPPPEDLGNDAEASLVTTLWMMSPNMWPQAGEGTSPTY